MPEVATPEAAQVCLGRTPAVVFFFRDGLPAVLNFRRVRNNRIRKLTPDGVISTVAGTGTEGFSGDFGPATAARFSFPRGLALDEAGNLYIADRWNHRIRCTCGPAASLE